jgi:hypothetical protein
VPFTADFIVADAHALLVSRAGPAVARRWLRTVPLTETRVTEDDYALRRRIAVMARLGTQAVFAFDEQFDQYGFERLAP